MIGPAEPSWDNPFERLRARWSTVPLDVAGERVDSGQLTRLRTPDLVRMWTQARDADDAGFDARGWYRLLYREFIRGKKILDIGCGLAFDSLTWLQAGAKHVTFVDIAETNLAVVERLAAALGVRRRATTLCIADPSDLASLPTNYDVVMAMGSLHNAPEDVMKPEALELARRLKPGGRWLQLAYPRNRWEREGALPFAEWGELTDGPGTPWEEWYDVPKLLALLEPARFDLVFYCEFHNRDFNWFDLVFRGFRA
jgi:SAM-dependent methyltransferase